LPGEAYVVLLKYSKSYFTSEGHAGPSYFVDASKVHTIGDCDNVPYVGKMAADGWLWSEPDGQLGEKLRMLTAGTTVYIQEGPVSGQKPPTVQEDGVWYFVLVGRQELDNFGWVWSTLISLK